MITALINHLWQSTLFCGGAWLITLTLRANSAALRHAIWLIASLKFLVPFSLLFVLGSYLGLPAARIADNQGPALGDALQSATVWVAPGALRATESGAASATLIALLAVWLGGALFVGVRWLLAWRVADSIAKTARPAPGALLDTRVTDADIEPAVARVFHPVVLLPAALLARLSSTQMSAVLAHEHEHIARRDNLKANAHRLVETLFWFHPAVWWIGRQMLEERERACDEAVLESGHDSTDYAGGILEVCRHCRTRAPVFAAAASGDLTRRVRYILGSGRPASVSALKAMSLIGAMAVIAAAPLFAGAAYGAARRHDLLTANLRTLGSADIYLELAPAGMDSPREIVAARNEVIIRNSTLRDMVALAYGVRSWEVIGGGEWMDSPRYVVRAVAQTPVSEPQDLDPNALQGAVTKLLASRFDLQVHVNNRCQSPCGRLALTASKPPR